MDDFPGLLSGEFGLRPQGKSAPMAGSRGGSIPGRSSDSMPMPSFSSSTSSNARSNRESSLSGDMMPVDRIFGGSSKQDYGGGGLGDLDGIFLGGGSGSVNKRNSAAANSSASLGLDSVFDGFQDPTVKTTHSGPIFDKPVYDDDMFGGIPGLKATSTGKFDDVFASLSSASTHQHMPVQDDDILRDLKVKGQRASVPGPKQSENSSHRMPLVDDDILGNLSRKDYRSSVSERKQSADDMDKSMHSFDDLIPGFGSSSPPQERDYSHAKHQRSSSQSNKAETSVFDDPFVELNSKYVPAQPSSEFVMNPLDNIRASSGKTMSDISSGLFDNGNIFNGPNKVMPPFSSEVNDNEKCKSSLKTAQDTIHKNPHIANESFEASINNFSDISSKKVSTGSSRKPANTQFNIPSEHLETGASSGRFGFPSVDSNLEPENEHSHDVEEIWLTVSEVPLFTQPTNAPAPSRPPPPFRKVQNPFGDKGAYSNAKFKGNAAFLFQQRTQSNVPSGPFNESPKTFGVSSVDELEDFSMGRRQAYAYEQSETVSSEEDNETNSAAAAAAAATAAALDNAEAKMKQAKELRERRESRNSKNMDFPYQVKKDKGMEDCQSQESKEKEDDFYHELKLREKEEKEKEKRRLERERERAAVEKALQEVRERAVAEARQKAERAAVEKANAEARERAARAAVQKATAEARERAAAEARERASAETKEKLAREAREKTAAIQREREAREIEAKEREAREKASAIQRERERAAVQRATQDARLRAERAAVEKANREARERAAAAAREKLQKSENDLDSVFGMGSRATSEPKQRASTPDVSFDTQVQYKGNSGEVRTMPSATSNGMRKTSSANFLDDLNSVFGAPPSSGEFQEIDGESEERRRARMERHQRTRERAAKALAEKNQRDMQVQMEQVERDRIAERLEIEIKRWAAGKEGNLRALLSTLQYVLWPECGWQAISLTDLITSASVKKAYRKATLHIHPDKVQQKGANLEQKIIAEKVFDLLKEAWNKFNSEELF